MKTLLKLIITALAIAMAALLCWHFLTPHDTDRGIRPAKIEDVRHMVELSSIEIYEEVPLKGHSGSRHLVAMQRVEGRIGYDLEKITMEEKGDTIVVTLPPETITLRESTRPESYVVIDECDDNPLKKNSLTAAEANEMKAKNMRMIKRSLQRRGLTARARHVAIANVTSMLQLITRRPVVVQ